MAISNTARPWRRAFLRELARGGSVALAAASVGIDRSSAYQVRRKNPAFAASWERALERAREKLELAGPCPSTPPAASLRIDCREAAGRDLGPSGSSPESPACAGAHEVSGRRVRLRSDEVVRSSKAGRPCVVRAGPGRWSVASERAFLAALSGTANVKAAARAAGVSAQAAYNRRRLWPAFAASWDAARAEGWVRLEMLLIHAATATLDPEPDVEAREAPEMSVEQAMKLWFHRTGREGAQGGRGRGYGWRREEPDIEEVRAEILRKVAAMERGRG